MPLNDRQIGDLARAIDTYLSLPALTQMASEIDVDLGNLAPNGSLETRAEALLKRINAERPPRDREFLELIARRPQGEIAAGLRSLAEQLLKPTYYPASARDAVLLGQTGFFGRDGLRQGAEAFTNSSTFTSRVLIVQGNTPGGKTYSWEYLRHLAVEAGAVPRQLRLKDEADDPRSVVEAVGRVLRLNLTTLPPLADNPQKTRINALLNWFQGELVGISPRYWLVIDDLNEPAVTPEVRACALALASIVERVKPDNLWMVLLGYNDVITDRDMRYCVRDLAAFPTADVFARNFVSLAAASNVPLSPAKATEYATLLFSKYGAIDRTAMEELTFAAEGLGHKLLQGQQL